MSDSFLDGSVTSLLSDRRRCQQFWTKDLIRSQSVKQVYKICFEEMKQQSKEEK